MAWRMVKQPDGRYARFSEVVDDFTHVDMTREQALALCRESLNEQEAEGKLRRADHDPGRYQEALDAKREASHNPAGE